MSAELFLIFILSRLALTFLMLKSARTDFSAKGEISTPKGVPRAQSTQPQRLSALPLFRAQR